MNKKDVDLLYNEYSSGIKRYLYNRTGNKEDSEDLTSIVYEKALKGIENFKWQGISIKAWLYKIAKNTLIDYYRGHKKELSLGEHKDIVTQNPEKQILSDIGFEEILDNLSPRERKIIYMKFFEGHTNKNIAKELNLSETNVGSIIYRVLRKLRNFGP